MTLGPLQLSRRRTLRGLAAFVVTFLLAGHVLAATGLCVVTSPKSPGAVHEASVACAEHSTSGPDHAPAVQHHCPVEEPTAQARSVDLPAPQLAAAVASIVLSVVDPVVAGLTSERIAPEAPPPPLYVRLQRLRL
jgi:hypothetical protein